MRHADVEEDEVGIRLAHQRKHLRSRLRLADDLEAAVVLERALDPVEDEPVVVGDHDAHGDQCRTGPDAARGSADCARRISFQGYTCPVQGATLPARIAGRVPRASCLPARTLHGREGAATSRVALRRLLGHRSLSGGRDRLYAQTMSNELSRTPLRRGSVGPSSRVDRSFPLLWIGLYLLLPVSGWATEMFDVVVRPAARSRGAAVAARRRTRRSDRGQCHRAAYIELPR